MHYRTIVLFVSLSFLFSINKIDKVIDSINNGTYDFKNKGIIENDDINSLYLNGLIEIDGKKSKDMLVEYYKNYPDAIYAHDAVSRIAGYYYSKGLYVKSSLWYRKIPIMYPNSNHLNKSISYFLNSLVISGRTDSARYYAKEFSNKYPKLKINNDFLKNETKKSESKITDYTNNVSKSRYSVQIGTYQNYKSALSKKRLLSNEGFLSRIDEVYIKNDKMYSVRIGFYKKKSFALKEKNRLSSRLGIYDSIVVEVK